MKNSKREITLNERDSIRDMIEAEKTLAREYMETSFFEETKEMREALLSAAKRAAEAACFLSGLLQIRE